MPPVQTEIAKLERCIRQGDWTAAATLTDRMGACCEGMTAEELREHLARLRSLLTAARAGRANLGLIRGRLRAAAGFADCQDFGESANS